MKWTRVKLRQLADEDGVIKRGSVRVKIYPNGTIVRDDVQLELAKAMTVTEAVECLKLNDNMATSTPKP